MSEKRTGCPCQREQVSRRRNRQDVDAEVGDPWRPSHCILVALRGNTKKDDADALSFFYFYCSLPMLN